MATERFDDQVLLIDADDTLWENNIYFERVIAAATELLRGRGLDAGDFRSRLNERERRSIAINGYGTVHFTESLVTSFEAFLQTDPDTALVERVRSMALDIMNRPIELLDGVAETLEYLSGRHELHLVTKGMQNEQLRKVERSGLGPLFRSVEVVREKDEETYRGLAHRRGWPGEDTWMVGNSPRSDINPALAAGMNAVFVPHVHTWELEKEEPIDHERLLHLRSFQDLRDYF
jgi:putative hydrolase of the HAD superfamily